MPSRAARSSSTSSTSSGASPAQNLAFVQPLTPASTRGRPSKPAGRQPPRPPNAFIIYRSDTYKSLRAATDISDHRHISRMVAASWHSMSDEEKAPFKARAEQAKLQHQLLYPDYQFQPKQGPKRRSRKTYGNTPQHLELFSKVGALHAQLRDSGDPGKFTEAVHALGRVQEEPRPKKKSHKSKSPSASVPATSTSRKVKAAVRQASEESSSASSGASVTSPASNYSFDSPLQMPSTLQANLYLLGNEDQFSIPSPNLTVDSSLAQSPSPPPLFFEGFEAIPLTPEELTQRQWESNPHTPTSDPHQVYDAVYSYEPPGFLPLYEPSYPLYPNDEMMAYANFDRFQY